MDNTTADPYLHAAILLGLGLAARGKTVGTQVSRDESRIELHRLEKMEKYNEGIRKNSDGIADEIRKAERQLDLLLRKAKSALIGLNIELREEDVERSSPIALHSTSLAAATVALDSLPRRVASESAGPSEDYWPGAELHDGEIEEPPVETVIGRQGPGLNHALRQKDGRGDPPGWSLNEEGP